MKKTSIGILIGIALSLGSVAVAQTNLIEVPQTIGSYNTLDLLNYLATLKAQSDAKNQIANTPAIQCNFNIKTPQEAQCEQERYKQIIQSNGN